jgi:hypothetical protein
VLLVLTRRAIPFVVLLEGLLFACDWVLLSRMKVASVIRGKALGLSL